jgi:mono/diheme cytochrome c family protein
MVRSGWHTFVWLALVILWLGCSRPAEFRPNTVDQLVVERTELPRGEHFSAEARAELDSVLTALFGTPDAPKIVSLDESPPLVSLDRLAVAAGPVSSNRQGQRRGLYREHCAHCHGVTGDGAGPTAAFLNPYPRDFRLGRFKFKSTPVRRAPTDEDLTRVLRHGIPGTAMPSFALLEDEEIAALVDYVKYLAIRGQVEHALVRLMADLDGESLLESPDSASESAASDDGIAEPAGLPEPSLDNEFAMVLEECYLPVIERWAEAPTQVTEVPPLPAEFFADRTPLADAGKVLFYGKANCAQCHGMTGLGDGLTQNYDDWTNEWVKGANVDPRDPESFGPFVAAGAFPPRPLRPRNLRLGVMRGGDRPEDLYRRIANGIEGTGMPAATTLSAEEIWALVAFVLELPHDEQRLAGSTE